MIYSRYTPRVALHYPDEGGYWSYSVVCFVLVICRARPSLSYGLFIFSLIRPLTRFPSDKPSVAVVPVPASLFLKHSGAKFTIGSGLVLGGQPYIFCPRLVILTFSRAKLGAEKRGGGVQSLLEEPSRVGPLATSSVSRLAGDGEVAQIVDPLKLLQTVSVVEVKSLLGVQVCDEELEALGKVVDAESAGLAGREPALEDTRVTTPALAGILGMVVYGAGDGGGAAAITLVILGKCWGCKSCSARGEDVVELHVVVLLDSKVLGKWEMKYCNGCSVRNSHCSEPKV